MTIMEQVDAYRELLDEKDRLKEATTENNKAIEAARDTLAQTMLDEETPKISRSGYSYTMQPKTKYSKASGKDEELMDTLRSFGLGDLIKETVNAQSLQGAMSNLASENDDALPDEFADCVNTFEFYDVARRKDKKVGGTENG
jgi:5'-3' exonuclease